MRILSSAFSLALRTLTSSWVSKRPSSSIFPGTDRPVTTCPTDTRSARGDSSRMSVMMGGDPPKMTPSFPPSACTLDVVRSGKEVGSFSMIRIRFFASEYFLSIETKLFSSKPPICSTTPGISSPTMHSPSVATPERGEVGLIVLISGGAPPKITPTGPGPQEIFLVMMIYLICDYRYE